MIAVKGVVHTTAIMHAYSFYIFWGLVLYTKIQENFYLPCKHYCEKIKFYLSFYKIVGQEKHELENLMRQ